MMIGKHLRSQDYITSNHRCHGHFIAATGNWRGLIDELVGNADGVCAGIGSSQHLCAPNFISNGQQGGLLPVAAGIAMDRKIKNKEGVAISFIGEGTLGEGVVYETMNLDCLWGLPHIIVCENNFYSQSTPQSLSVAGDINSRAAAFGMKTLDANTWDLPDLDRKVSVAFEYARSNRLPVFLVIRTYRLNPHSKGDDTRSVAELEWFRDRDPTNLILRNSNSYRDAFERFSVEVAEHIEAALVKPRLSADAYLPDQLPRAPSQRVSWRPQLANKGDAERVNAKLGRYFRQWMDEDDDVFLIGEDVLDPYGGAFKVTKGLSSAHPGRVYTTPISEAGITGLGVGLAIAGRRPLVEIMFGDFMTLTFDQLVNNASKFYQMFNRQISCPIVVRTPMGGRRGYGPTHSQSLERFFIGIDNTVTLAVNSLIDIDRQLHPLRALRCPAVVLENKVDYTHRLFEPPPGFTVEIDEGTFPTCRVRPSGAQPTTTLLAYGGIARYVAERLEQIFEEADIIPELVVPCLISPIALPPVLDSIGRTRHLVVIEEGTAYGSVGAELIASLHSVSNMSFRSLRISSHPVPIPSVPSLEDETLPSLDRICDEIRSWLSQESPKVVE